MRKLWLTFTAMLLCSIASFAQTPLTQANFVSAITENPSGSFILTEDINLGDLGERTASIIEGTFSGTFNGKGKTITYQASFIGTTAEGNYSLFDSVSGTIDSLNVQANVTLSGTANNMDVGLICGALSGTIEYCNASGNINSTVNAANGGGSDAGLIVGESAGIVRYSTGTGNVVGVGYAGGLIGQMKGNASVLACSFAGSVTANNPSNTSLSNLGSFAGGICGYASDDSSLEFCAADADINGIKVASGISSTKKESWFIVTFPAGSPDVENSYAAGNVNGTPINDNTMTNSSGTTTPNYYEGEMELDQIVFALNSAIPNDQKDKFYFDVINGEVVLIIGQRPTTPDFVCESPIGLTVSIENGIFTADWDVEGQDESYYEQEFIISISGGGFSQAGEQIVSESYYQLEAQFPFSVNPYVFTVKSKCDTEFSNALTYTFYVNESCNSINALQANNVTSTTANIIWQGEADEVKLNGEAVAFINGQTLALTNLTPGLSYTIEAIVYCTVDGEVETLTTSVNFTTHGERYETKQTGRFNDPNTWLDNAVPKGDIATIIINTGHRVTVDHDLKITEDYKIVENNGVLQIKQQGQLINNTTTDVPGIIEIVSAPKANQAWTFIGAPFQDNYVLGCILPESHDVSVKKYDYTEGGWSDSWAHIGTPMNAGEGYFAFPFLDAPITFTTYGDVGTYEDRGNIGYTSTNTVTDLNISNVEVSLPSNCPNNWMALSNPYPAKLSVSKFLAENGSKLQGNCVYVFRDGSFDQGNINTGDIAMTEGFFVNFANNAGDKTITFNKGQLSYNNPNLAKASANEFIKLTLINGNKKVRAYLAHNENAEQGYDIFDANKLFAPTEIAEPYFVTDGIELMKEEFAELPYYATMNVRSFADDTVSFVVNNIPEGLAVSIIDGENVIDMVEGGVYTTEILTGENADRFKVLIKKNLGIADVEELEVNITNNNRHISIATTETDLQVEVYNALGQKVLSTKDRNFTLNQVSAGAYLIKAFNNKASKTQKIVVE
ncbi:MAG: T9SS type A sorting domain-containing protein [Bacteroidales bacterium]|nr:T9SS type A sorting domain-containing protein [Bacteroidales bacterium]